LFVSGHIEGVRTLIIKNKVKRNLIKLLKKIITTLFKYLNIYQNNVFYYFKTHLYHSYLDFLKCEGCRWGSSCKLNAAALTIGVYLVQNFVRSVVSWLRSLAVTNPDILSKRQFNILNVNFASNIDLTFKITQMSTVYFNDLEKRSKQNKKYGIFHTRLPCWWVIFHTKCFFFKSCFIMIYML
jgi:hypothetical protein